MSQQKSHGSVPNPGAAVFTTLRTVEYALSPYQTRDLAEYGYQLSFERLQAYPFGHGILKYPHIDHGRQVAGQGLV